MMKLRNSNLHIILVNPSKIIFWLYHSQPLGKNIYSASLFYRLISTLKSYIV